jgi:signal transduction histidine kinase
MHDHGLGAGARVPSMTDVGDKAASAVAHLAPSRARAIELEAENRRLEAENRRLEAADRLKSEFLANMSHELRTPLNSVIGFAELLYDEQVGPLAAKQREFLGDILAGGRHLLRLVNDVLDLAKVEAGKMDFRPEPVDVSMLLGSVVQGLRTTALDKRIAIQVLVDPSLDDVIVDPGRLEQVLYNYVSNALKFTPEGGRVVVRARAEEGDRFRVEVEDTGVGIAAERVPHLFQVFQQANGCGGQRAPGTGLGLALTKRLAEAQGGEVGLRSELHRGSTFFAILPRRPKATAPAHSS